MFTISSLRHRGDVKVPSITVSKVWEEKWTKKNSTDYLYEKEVSQSKS